ncbi:MAG: energy transducer TonB [Bacteroidota bacterium]
MKYYHFSFLTFIFISNIVSAQKITFAESEWKQDSTYHCKLCATCEDNTQSHIVKRKKEFVFYCNDLLVGRWYLIEDHLPQCDSVFYHTSNAAKTNIGSSDFFMVDLALFDIYKEVKTSCPIEMMYSAKPLPSSQAFEYSLHIQQFFPMESMEILGEEGIVFEEEDLDQLPLLKICNLQGIEEVKTCMDMLRREYIYPKIEYPIMARRNNIQGTVYVSFVIEKDGTMTNFEIMRDIGGGCGQEVYDAVYSLHERGFTWEAGKINGEKVRSKKIIDVKFTYQ